MNQFIETISSANQKLRNRSFFELCCKHTTKELLDSFHELETFRKKTSNLYERVRACIFLYAGFRFYLLESKEIQNHGHVPVEGYNLYLERNFEKAIQVYYKAIAINGANANLLSALAENYHQLTFQSLADQVRKSVRSSIGNQWMFRVGHYDEHPLKFHPLLMNLSDSGLYPILQEKTAVRMDLTHSAWSDIFFLGMDYPEGARVINVSVDLAVYKRDNEIKPPIESYIRVISEPVLRITSLDLNDSKDITELSDLFNFGNDYLSLLKAAIIASGLIPPSFEGTNHSIKNILEKILLPNLGLELVTKVNDIPKGSRLAVSTNLLASMISALMRATHQTQSLEGPLTEQERRLIASRAILGEWIGGSGGGWQDSGGIWPGIKTIEGVTTKPGDPEFNISRGCLLPKHNILDGDNVDPSFEKNLSSSLVLMHGGMASNVGPILEMVTEKYLLRSKKEWLSRLSTNAIYDQIKETIKTGNIKQLAEATLANFNGPIKTIIPWATTHYTEVIILKAKQALGNDFWGFLMLGGMSGGGMGMFVNPSVYENAKDIILQILRETKNELSTSLPFAMDPVIYNFKINNKGSTATILKGNLALMPRTYYTHHIPRLVRENPEKLALIKKREIDLVTSLKKGEEDSFSMLRSIVGNLFNISSEVSNQVLNNSINEVEKIKKLYGFDYIQHEQIRQDMRKGRIGLSHNRLSAETIIEDVDKSDIHTLSELADKDKVGELAIVQGKIAILCLAGGVGSRWTKGAGVIKAINPFVEMDGRHRSFLEVHLAKTHKTAQKFNTSIPFIIATSNLTHQAIFEQLKRTNNFNYPGEIYLSEGKSLGHRLIPMERDLRFLWEVLPQEQLDENKQKVRTAVRETLISWAKAKGEGSDYTQNVAGQLLNPLGHWYEVSNILRNGTLAKLLNENTTIEHIFLHNLDTLGADISSIVLSNHINSGNALTFEVISRRSDDKGGGLARINGKVRLLEGLAQPHDEDELGLSYYNTMSTWINIDKLLNLFGLNRKSIQVLSEVEISEAIRNVARRMPSYVTIKDVKYRWGHGQEDIYPVAQIEKLWSDMSALTELKCDYIVVSRLRGQQLKDHAQLDAWVIDGSKEYIESLCEFKS